MSGESKTVVRDENRYICDLHELTPGTAGWACRGGDGSSGWHSVAGLFPGRQEKVGAQKKGRGSEGTDGPTAKWRRVAPPARLGRLSSLPCFASPSDQCVLSGAASGEGSREEASSTKAQREMALTRTGLLSYLSIWSVS